MVWKAGLIAVTAGALALAGCGGITVASYHGGSPPVETRTSESATYALYSTDESRPVVTVVLPQNTEIGFRRGTVGQIVAVAGNQEFPLSPDKTYYWKQR